jgi:hypothetical protein
LRETFPFGKNWTAGAGGRRRTAPSSTNPRRQSPVVVVARHQRLIFVDDMTTIKQLKDEIQALQEKNDGYKKQFAEVIWKGIEEMAPGDKQSMIKFLENRIGTNEALILKNTDLIVAKEIENDKRITIAKQADAADKEYRLQRGEITDCTLIHR